MKQIFFSLIACFFTLSSTVHAASTEEGDQYVHPSSMVTNTKSSATLDMKAGETGKDKKTGEKDKKTPPIVIPPPVILPKPVAQSANYFHPGILVLQNGEWQGSDHLLNLTNQIGIYLTILKPDNLDFEIPEDKIKSSIEFAFQASGIKTQTLAYEGRPPLPAFELEIFIYPIERGFVAFCEGRLFESVTLSRFRIDPGIAYQAITWEKQSLLVSPTAQFSAQLEKGVKEIAEAFAERFKAYSKISAPTTKLPDA